jgi:hypothetical protein
MIGIGAAGPLKPSNPHPPDSRTLPPGGRSAFGFIDKTNGNVLKPADWKGPAKNFCHGNIRDENKGCGRVRWTGVF